MFKHILLICMGMGIVNCASAQDIKNTSYTTRTGEKVLRLEVIVPVTIDKAWACYTR